MSPAPIAFGYVGTFAPLTAEEDEPLEVTNQVPQDADDWVHPGRGEVVTESLLTALEKRSRGAFYQRAAWRKYGRAVDLRWQEHINVEFADAVQAHFQILRTRVQLTEHMGNGEVRCQACDSPIYGVLCTDA